MPLDPERLIGAVAREISDTRKDGAPAQVLVATRMYDTTPDDLWDALTNPERLPRWFLPVSGDLRPGGRFEFEGYTGGEILACEPPSRLVVTWGMHGQVSWVSVDLSPDPESGTRLRLEHTVLVPDDTFEEYGPGAAGVGWDQALLGLDQLYSPSPSVTPDNAMEWLATEEARSFIRRSCDAWCAAAIAAGAEPGAARRAADKTSAAYCGEDPAPEAD